ncbi:mechanosensitive ion channel family protein [Halobacteriaceae archaeon SHR40]|uniref:mechanosensitive ion channel family protein n=1 Tax=Halovenus amylolytica TaxID=2500550 RepID=UPI000FE3E6A1
MTDGSQLVTWLESQQILVSICLSLLLIVLIWRVDLILDGYTSISDQTVEDIRGFRAVATATLLVVSLIWISNRPTPGWLADLSQSVGWPAILAGIVDFLPRFVVGNSGAILVTLLGGWWAWNMRTRGDRVIERFVEQKYDETIAPIVENVWDVTIFAAFVLLILDQWGISIATLVAPAGIIGIIVGFSARKTVANFFGSISLYADDTYSRGDFIELESGISGTVRDISVRSTVLQTLDGDHVTIPNSELNEGKIINKSSPRPTRRIRSQISVSYDADPERVKTVLSEAAEPISQQHDPEVHLRSFGDSALIFEVFVWIDEPEDRLPAENELNTAIYRALESAGIEIPYPQQEVTIDGPTPADGS